MLCFSLGCGFQTPFFLFKGGKMTKIIATKAILLARVSTSEQAGEQHHSIPSQIDKGRKYCEKADLEIVKEFQIDESSSRGKKLKFFETVIRTIKEAEEPLALVARAVDRASREFSGSVVLELEELRKNGKAELHFLRENLVVHRNSNSYEIWRWHLEVLLAERDILVLKENIKEAIKRKLPKGQRPGYTPTGYLNVKKEIEPEIWTKEIKIDEKRAPLVKECFERYSKGDVSLDELTLIMRNKDFTIKPKRRRVNGKLMKKSASLITRSGLNSILHNSSYCGFFPWKDPDDGNPKNWPAEDYKPIISKQLFDKVQRQLKNKSLTYRTNKFYKFRKLIKCGFCDCYLTADNQEMNYKNRKPEDIPVYYKCTSGKKNADPDFYKNKFGEAALSYKYKKVNGKTQKIAIYRCPQEWWKEDEIEELIKKEFEVMEMTKEKQKEMKIEVNQRYQDRFKSSGVMKGKLKADNQKDEKLIGQLVRDMGSNELVKIKLQIADEIENLSKKVEERKKGIEKVDKLEKSDVDQYVEFMILSSNLRKQYEGLNPEHKRQLLLTAFREIRARKGKAKVGAKVVGSNALHFVWTDSYQELWSEGVDKLISKQKENNALPNY